jgi:hypothetical protein
MANPHGISLQKLIATEISSTQTLHVILEHFSFEMQFLLDDFKNDVTEFDDLIEGYNEVGTEGHDL